LSPPDADDKLYAAAPTRARAGAGALTLLPGHFPAMLTEIYIEALDEELADQVWEAWEIDD